MRLTVNQEMCRFESCPESQGWPAKVTVTGEPYKLRSSRSERRLGSTPSAGTMPGSWASGPGRSYKPKQTGAIPVPGTKLCAGTTERTWTRLLSETQPWREWPGAPEVFMSLNRLVLCINASYEPVNIITARRAIIMVCKGVALVEEVSQYLVRASRISIPVPNVIRLVRYRRVPRQSRSVSRKGILLRDGFTCQYCRSKLPAGDLTLDHVVPRSRGGMSTWENLVACCFGCNNRKSNRTPLEAGMPLIKQPLQISIHAKHKLLRGDERAWDRYLFA